ncbi:MAG TPA: GNAT family N-acetyltransferase [Solirubrobacteraceae bacterium]
MEPWGRDDLPLLRRCVGDPAMMEHLGGAEGEAKIAERQARYERPGSRQFRIVDGQDGERVGWVGYWERSWDGEHVFETGWAVVPSHQGRGIAAEATRQLIDRARSEGTRRFIYAYPSVENGASNAICRKLDFELLRDVDLEYPKGSWMRCNVWRLDLEAR